MQFNTILETIGCTPLVRLNKIADQIPCQVFAKIESFNPGLSAKDRIALHMIEVAERRGQLLPGGTVIDSTSGNTGYSIALVCAVKGYQCILTVTDKIAPEKLTNLRALGAQVILCPKDVKPEHPDSYYMQARTLAKEIPNSFFLDQNYNTKNAEAHYLTTGPEIWADTRGKITHLIGAASTGGTLSGSAQFLKEMNPELLVFAADAFGSALQKYHETRQYDPSEIYAYNMEGVGKNIIPPNVDFDIITQFIKVTDLDSAHKARKLALQEGIMAGHSSGATLQVLDEIKHTLRQDDVVVLIFSDHGSKYASKLFSEHWQSNFENQTNYCK